MNVPWNVSNDVYQKQLRSSLRDYALVGIEGLARPKVWKTVIMPKQPLTMHRHECGRVVVGLKGGTLKKIESTGEESPLVFETDKACWLAKDEAGTLHGDVNESDHPIEIMVIEVKSTASK